MDDNVYQLPPRKEEPVSWMVGPFTSWRVVIEGRAIPRLTAQPLDDGLVNLIVDSRFGILLPEAQAKDVAWLVAQALAVGSGYAFLGAQNRDRPFAPEIRQIGSIETDD